MTRLELLQLLLAQARTNGFEFRRWYTSRLGLPWSNLRYATEMLVAERHYYALLFSHEFARSFWKSGAPITFMVPSTFLRMPRRLHRHGRSHSLRPSQWSSGRLALPPEAACSRRRTPPLHAPLPPHPRRDGRRGLASLQELSKIFGFNDRRGCTGCTCDVPNVTLPRQNPFSSAQFLVRFSCLPWA